MGVAHLEILVEEDSMEAALRELLPKLAGDMSFAIHRHQGKADLLRKLPKRLHAYSKFLPPDWRIVVLVDCDNDDCRSLKRKLEDCAHQAGLATRTTPEGGDYVVVNRLAIEELEAWYFGDWNAVMRAFPKIPHGTPRRRQYRNPDAIKGGTWEAFERIMQRAEYFSGGLRKIEAARMIAANWNPDSNTSASFCAFRDAIRDLAS